MEINNLTTHYPKRAGDKWRWLLIFILVGASIVANYYFISTPWAIRAAIGIVIAAMVVGLFALTRQGTISWDLLKGMRIELRKVVWPTRQETWQTTMVVVVVVIIAALILWMFDSFFLWMVSILMGQRG